MRSKCCPSTPESARTLLNFSALGILVVKLLKISPHSAPAWRCGGIVESVWQSARSLARAGVQVRLLTTDGDGMGGTMAPSEYATFQSAEKLEVTFCRRLAYKSASLAMLARLPVLVREADVVELHGIYSFPVIPALLTARILGRPLVWSLHGMLQRWEGIRRPHLKAAWESICTMAAPPRTVLRVTSEQEARESAGRMGVRRTEIIPNGVSIPKCVEHCPRVDSLRMVFLGRLDPKKGIENLLEACRLLNARGLTAWTLAIAGSGPALYRTKLRALSGSTGVPGQIAMLGDVRGESKERLFESADLVVAPSYTENFCNVVAEALARAVPVIASYGTPWAEIEQAGCGLWVSNDPSSLADAIAKMSTMPLREMGERGRAWIAGRYSWDRYAIQMIDLIKSMTESDGAGTAAAGARC